MSWGLDFQKLLAGTTCVSGWQILKEIEMFYQLLQLMTVKGLDESCHEFSPTCIHTGLDILSGSIIWDIFIYTSYNVYDF